MAEGEAKIGITRRKFLKVAAAFGLAGLVGHAELAEASPANAIASPPSASTEGDTPVIIPDESTHVVTTGDVCLPGTPGGGGFITNDTDYCAPIKPGEADPLTEVRKLLNEPESSPPSANSQPLKP